MQLYEALRALDEHATASGHYANKDNLGRQARRALQAFRAKRRKVSEPPAMRLPPRIVQAVARN